MDSSGTVLWIFESGEEISRRRWKQYLRTVDEPVPRAHRVASCFTIDRSWSAYEFPESSALWFFLKGLWAGVAADGGGRAVRVGADDPAADKGNC